MRVYVDMDGVLADFDGAMESYLLDKGWETTNRVEWSLSKRIQRIDGSLNTLDEAEHVVNSIMETKGFWEGIQPIQNGTEIIKKWMKLWGKNLDIMIATSAWWTSPYSAYEKVRWIQKYIKGFPLTNIAMTFQKHILKGEIIIDDKPANIMNWEGSDAIIFTQPWNKNIPVSLNIERIIWRADDWSVVDSIVDYLMQKNYREKKEVVSNTV